MSGMAIEEDDELVLCFCLKLKFCIHVFVFASSFVFLQNTRCNVGAGLHRCREKNLDCTPGTSLRTKISSYAEQISASMHTFFFTSTHCAMPTSASSENKAQTTADNAPSQLFFSRKFSGFASKTLPELNLTCHRPLASSNIRSTPTCPFISGFIFRPCSRTSRPGASSATSDDVLEQPS